MDSTQPMLFADFLPPETKPAPRPRGRPTTHKDVETPAIRHIDSGGCQEPLSGKRCAAEVSEHIEDGRTCPRSSEPSRPATVEQILADLTGPQRDAVTHTDGPLLILAGPGTGKTRVVTRRAAHLALTAARPSEILAITFTNKAAKEMRERIDALGVGRGHRQLGPGTASEISRSEPAGSGGTAPLNPAAPGGITVSTFHAFCAGLLRRYGERMGVSRGFTIFDRDDRRKLLQQAIDDAGFAQSDLTPASVEQRISWAKNQLISPEAFAQDEGDWRVHLIAPVFAHYEKLLARMDGLDFDDLLMRTAKCLSQDEGLRAELERRYRYVLVDEYQDTNTCQYQIARLLTRESNNLCATGDPDQSIYGWRGADIGNILSFERDYPTAKVVRLEQNYRSTKRILNVADHLIVGNVRRKQKALWTENETGPAVRAMESETGELEAIAVAEDVARRIRNGTPPGSIAVFYRVNSLSRTIEEALLRAGVAYQVARGVEFYNRKEIKDVLSYLRVFVNPADEVALLRIINTPTRGIGSTTVDRLVGLARQSGVRVIDLLLDPASTATLGRGAAKLDEFAALLRGLKAAAAMQPLAAVEFVLGRSGLRAMYADSGEADDSPATNLDELLNAAAAFQGDNPEAVLADWLEYAALVSDVDAIEDARQAVTLMTLHAAKGLEFDCVYMIAMENGLLPFHRGSENRGDEEEERRLCFVGMTRARKRLTLSLARYRMARGATARTTRSPFLDELPKSLVEWAETEPSPAPTYSPRSNRERLPDDIEEWSAGTLVRHPVQGLGQVMGIERGAKRTVVDVLFQDGSRRKWMLEFADLTRVGFEEVGE